jgi:putative phage-type endonuclease
MTRAIPTARRVSTLAPGNPEWLKLMTGSKIAAVLGLSPWESRFSLWHRMKGTVPAQAEDDVERRGHYLEPAICQWWVDEHPEWKIVRTGTFVHRHRRWQAATPDRLAKKDGELIVPVEAKSDAGGGWGEPDTEVIPVYYRAQIIWTLDVTGLPHAEVPMISDRLEFRRYFVDYDADEAEYMRAEALEFLRSLEKDEEPDIDEHSATYEVIREMHPDIDDREEKLTWELAERFRDADLNLKAAKAEKSTATSEVAKAMGSARYAVDPNGDAVAMRVPKGIHPPYVKAATARKVGGKIGEAA